MHVSPATSLGMSDA